MLYSQSNTQPGPIPLPTNGVDFTGKDGLLAKIVSANGVGNAALPTAQGDATPHLVVDGDTTKATVQPFFGESNRRVRMKGAGSAGAKLVLADPTVSADAGKLRALPGAAGTYSIVGIAEDDFVDGQLGNVRPYGPYVITQ